MMKCAHGSAGGVMNGVDPMHLHCLGLLHQLSQWLECHLPTALHAAPVAVSLEIGCHQHPCGATLTAVLASVARADAVITSGLTQASH